LLGETKEMTSGNFFSIKSTTSAYFARIQFSEIILATKLAEVNALSSLKQYCATPRLLLDGKVNIVKGGEGILFGQIQKFIGVPKI